MPRSEFVTLINISRPEWDRRPATPAGNPRVAIIVPARNEEALYPSGAFASGGARL